MEGEEIFFQLLMGINILGFHTRLKVHIFNEPGQEPRERADSIKFDSTLHVFLISAVKVIKSQS